MEMCPALYPGSFSTFSDISLQSADRERLFHGAGKLKVFFLVSISSLHWINDLPGALRQVNHAF